MYAYLLQPAIDALQKEVDAKLERFKAAARNNPRKLIFGQNWLRAAAVLSILEYIQKEDVELGHGIIFRRGTFLYQFLSDNFSSDRIVFDEQKNIALSDFGLLPFANDLLREVYRDELDTDFALRNADEEGL